MVVSKQELERIVRSLIGMFDYKVLALVVFHKAVSDKARRGQKLPIDIRGLEWEGLVETPARYVDGLYQLAERNKLVIPRFGELLKVAGVSQLKENPIQFNRLIQTLNKVDFAEYPTDLIGDFYETILRVNAPIYARKGEIFTPPEVAILVSKLLDPKSNSTIIDPACGTAGLLLPIYKQQPNIGLIGQDIKGFLVGLAELNMVLHGIPTDQWELYVGDSITNPRFPIGDYVVANPPWNLKGLGESQIKQNPIWKEIYRFGIPTSQSADWLWLQLATYYAKEKAIVILDTGALFRGGREQRIRKQFIEADLIEAVILLPEKIFYNTQSAGVIIVINKDKPPARKNKILFVDASNQYQKHPEIKRLNQLTDIDQIAETYHKFTLTAGVPSNIITTDQIAKNDFNLNPPLYISQPADDDPTPLEELIAELDKLTEEYNQKFQEIKDYINQVKSLL